MMRCLAKSSLLASFFLSKCTSFVVLPTNSKALVYESHLLKTSSSSESERSATVSNFAAAQTLEMKLLPHRPMGCTVEESLAGGHHVFVANLLPGGYAEQAGIKVGDVILGVSGLFGEVTDVTGLGIEKVKGLVASRPEEEALELKLARGTSVIEDHERALVDLCSDPGGTDAEMEQCVLDYIKEGYAAELDADEGEDVCGDDGTECLVESLYNMWAEDLPLSETPSESPVEEEAAPKAKPWSSRSSPSGTFVRDPVTGKMKNIE